MYNLLLLGLAALAPSSVEEDLRTVYDVEAYDLQLAVRPDTEVLEGVVDVVAVALQDGVRIVRLDLHALHEVLAVANEAGRPLDFERIEHGLVAELPAPVDTGTRFTVRVHYRGKPTGQGFDGFHWERSEDGSPWINTACQGIGAHYWYPCKASFFHPDDKPARVSMAIVCPAELFGVSNGRLLGVSEGVPEWFDAGDGDWKTYRWRHDYPLETYTVTLNVGPYVVVEDELEVTGIEAPVPFVYYVLPENAEKAAVQFRAGARAGRDLLRGLRSVSLSRIEVRAGGNQLLGDGALDRCRLWLELPGLVSRERGEGRVRERRNRWFDYILVHEVAHEWWGNAVSADHWGHFWVHEGFGTYAEGVYVEFTRTRADADRFFAEMGRRVPADEGSLYRGDHPESGAAYSGLIYFKGACVLNTLRHYVNDDEAWWKSLREFNLSYRYGNATTEEFQAVLEANTGAEWGTFFQEWFYGSGTPALEVAVSTEGDTIVVEVENASGSFHVPIDVSWTAGESSSTRLWFGPDDERAVIECGARPTNVSVDHLDRLLGKHAVKVR